MPSDADGPIPASALTVPRQAADYLLKKDSSYNALGSQMIFQARVIAVQKTIGSLESRAFGMVGSNSAEGATIASVRIIDPRMSHARFLAPACRISVAQGDLASVRQQQALLLQMVVPKSQTQFQQVAPGTIVEVLLKPGDNGAPYNLKIGTFIKIVSQPPSGGLQDEVCAPMSDLFDDAPLAATPGSAGSQHSRSRPAADQTPEAIGSLTIENKLNESVGRKDEPLSPTGITIHYTAGGSSASAISTLNQKGYSYHFIISRDGTIEQLERTDVQSIHDPKTNATHIGISFVNLGNQPEFAGEYGSPALNKWISGDTTTGTEDKWDPYPLTQTLAGRNW